MITQLFTPKTAIRTAGLTLAASIFTLTLASGAQAIEPRSTPQITFTMPKEPVYGSILVNHQDWAKLRPATGTITLYFLEKIEFRATEELAKHPEVLDQLPNNNLIGLMLDSCKLGDKELQRVSKFPNLSKLSLKSTNITDAFLATAAKLASLKELDISHTGINGSGLFHLAKLSKLQTLEINSTKIAPDKLSQIDKLKSLTSLNVRQIGLTDDGLVAISKLKNLKVLKLGENPMLSDNGITSLERLKQLRLLDITGTRISHKAIAAMHFPKLQMIAVTRQQLRKNGLAILTNAYPGILICPGDTDEQIDSAFQLPY